MESKRKAATMGKGVYHLGGENEKTIEQLEAMGAAHSKKTPDLRDGIYSNECDQTYYSNAWEGRSCLTEISRSLT